MGIGRFLSELKERNVVRVAGVYTVSAWGVFQVAKTIFETLDFPKAVSAATLLVLSLGLPIAVGLSWVFERAPDGTIRRARRHSPDAPERKLNWIDWGFLAAIATVVVVFVATAVGLAGSLRDMPGRFGGSKNSVAVLPFQNFSPIADTEYFADGLTEEVINSLAQVPELKVAGRTSAFYFKGKNEDVRDIARKLNVSHVVEGSVRRSGDRLRVTTQLIDARDGYHVWSETYDRTMNDAFAIQTEIAEGVAKALKVSLKVGEARTARRDPEAYKLELVAKGQLRRKGKAQVEAAQAIYKRLVEEHPEEADFHAGYAYATAYLAQNHLEGDFLPAVREAESAIGQAIALDPNCSEAYVAKGMLSVIRLIREGRQAGESEAEEAYRKAIELAPRDPEALSLYGDFLAGRRPREAIGYLQRALEIDPLDRIASNALAGALANTGRMAEAEQRYRSNIELFPDFVNSKEELADLYVEQGRIADAVPWYRQAAEPLTDPSASVELANLYYNLGLERDAKLALAPWSSHPIVGPLDQAVQRIVAGDFQGLLALSQSKLAEKEPDPIWRSGVVLAALQLGRFDLAREQLLITSPELFQPVPEVSERLSSNAVIAAYVIDRTGDKAQARRILEATLAATAPKPGERQGNGERIVRVQAHAMLGDRESALSELRGAIDAGWRRLYDLDLFMRLDAYPMTESLRPDPRFAGMIREVQTDLARQRQLVIDRAASRV